MPFPTPKFIRYYKTAMTENWHCIDASASCRIILKKLGTFAVAAIKIELVYWYSNSLKKL